MVFLELLHNHTVMQFKNQIKTGKVLGGRRQQFFSCMMDRQPDSGKKKELEVVHVGSLLLVLTSICLDLSDNNARYDVGIA